MLEHYISHILPNGFKAQIAVSSRSASIKYYEALKKAQQQLIQELEQRATILREIDRYIYHGNLRRKNPIFNPCLPTS